jgi:hypothetical protein
MLIGSALGNAIEHPLQPVLNLFQERSVRLYFAVGLFPEKTFQVSKTWKVSEPDSLVPPNNIAVMLSEASPKAPAQRTTRPIGLLLLSRQTRRNKNHWAGASLRLPSLSLSMARSA